MMRLPAVRATKMVHRASRGNPPLPPVPPPRFGHAKTPAA
ncbi:hypothetical protein I546_2104 [Mycobacterium kansasii 732]|nr:hypothetical protein I546_2104 [Mycobacterium kansasii 732]